MLVHLFPRSVDFGRVFLYLCYSKSPPTNQALLRLEDGAFFDVMNSCYTAATQYARLQGRTSRLVANISNLLLLRHEIDLPVIALPLRPAPSTPQSLLPTETPPRPAMRW